MATIKAKIGIAAVIGLAILTPVAVKLHSRTNQNTEEEYRRLEREHLSEAAQHILPLIVYAGDNTNRLPETLDEVGLLDDRFELVHKGLLPTDTNVAPTTIILREKQAWRTPRGTWAKAYGYADGHSQLGTSTDGDFSAWESRQSATGRLAASRAEVEPRPAPRP